MFSFSKQKQKSEVQRLLRRIRDLTIPNQLPVEGDFRAEHRSNRSLPVLLVPWEQGAACVDECATAVTKDISGTGISLILRQPFRAEQVVIGFWLSTRYYPATDFEPLFFRGEVRQNVEIGGGFWQVGLRVTTQLAAAHQHELHRLKPIAARLVPPARRKPLTDAGL